MKYKSIWLGLFQLLLFLYLDFLKPFSSETKSAIFSFNFSPPLQFIILSSPFLEFGENRPCQARGEQQKNKKAKMMTDERQAGS